MENEKKTLLCDFLNSKNIAKGRRLKNSDFGDNGVGVSKIEWECIFFRDRLRHFIDKWVPFIGWAISAGYCNYLLKWWNTSHCNLWNFNWIKSSVPFFIITLLETIVQYTYRIKLKTKCNKSIHPGLFLHKIAKINLER